VVYGCRQLATQLGRFICRRIKNVLGNRNDETWLENDDSVRAKDATERQTGALGEPDHNVSMVDSGEQDNGMIARCRSRWVD
jgi:hypothetical protein